MATANIQITDYASLRRLWTQVNQPTCYALAWTVALALCANYFLADHCSITWARACSTVSPLNSP
jgi:hypothetical protein